TKLYEGIVADKSATAPQRMVATSVIIRLRRQQQWARQLLDEKLLLVRTDPTLVSVDDIMIAVFSPELTTKEARAVIAKVLPAQNDAERLNELVYVALAAGIKDEAFAAAKRLVDMQRDGRTLDTLAECYHARGDRQRALELEDQALLRVNGEAEAA